jgi:hypothetical protein
MVIDEFQKYPNTAGFFIGNVENVISTIYGFGGQSLPKCPAEEITNINRWQFNLGNIPEGSYPRH